MNALTLVLPVFGYLLSVVFLAGLSAAEAILVPFGPNARRELRQLRDRLPRSMESTSRISVVIFVGRALVYPLCGVCILWLAVQLPAYVSWLVGVVMVAAVPVVGEILPRMRYSTVTAEQVERAAKRLEFSRRAVLRFAVRPSLAVSNILARFLGGENLPSGPFVEEEEPESSGENETNGESSGLEAGRLMRSLSEFVETTVREVMVPRTSMEYLDSDSSLAEVLQQVTACLHSRIPVYQEDIDHVVGILYVKDLFALWENRERPQGPASADSTEQKRSFDLRDYIRPASFVPETKWITELFAEFKRERHHMAIVVDEYGGTAGLVTLEDLLEELVGEIQDEHDQEPLPYEKQEEGVYLVEGSMRIDHLREDLGIELPEAENYDTISGFLSAEMGKVPSVGESLHHGMYVLTVLGGDDRHIDRVKVQITPE